MSAAMRMMPERTHACHAGLDGETVKQLIGKGEQLSPDMIRALLDAKRLERAAHKAANAAEKKRRGGGRWNGGGSGSESEGEEPEFVSSDEDESDLGANAHGGGGGGGGGGGAAGGSRAHARQADNGEDGDEGGAAMPQLFEKKSRRGGTAKVMAVDESRVVM